MGTSSSADGGGWCLSVVVDDWGSGQKVVATGTSVGYGSTGGTGAWATGGIGMSSK